MMGRQVWMAVAATLAMSMVGWIHPLMDSAGSSIVLTLRYPSPPSTESGVPRVSGVTRIRLPLYPGSRPARRRLPLGYLGGIIGSPYARDGHTPLFSIQGRESRVMAWYRRYFSGIGEESPGLSTSVNLNTGVQEQGWTFSRGARQQFVTVAFYQEPHETLYGFSGSYLVTPPRPQWSRIPPLSRVNGSLQAQGGAKSIHTSSASALRELRAVLSHDNTVTSPWCPLAVNETAKLTLYPKHGHPISLKVSGYCPVQIGSVSLMNSQGKQLWWVLHRLVQLSA